MTITNTVSKINTALVAAQSNIGKATKDAVNPFFKSNYADLASVMEVVKKPLNDAGLAITQELQVHVNATTHVPFNVLQTTVRHVSGETITSAVVVPENKDIQKWGASITYLKRYSLQALLFVPTEDNDAEDVVKRKPVAPRQKAVAAAPF